MTAPQLRKKILAAAPWGMIFLLILVSALLLRQNLQMRAEMDKLKPKLLEKGDKVRAFNARGLQDEFIGVQYTGQGPKRLLLYFKPSCPYCREQFAHWQAVMNSVDTNRIEVLGLVANSEDRRAVSEYLRSVDCDSLPVAMVPPSELISYKLTRTPVTLLVSNEGKVERAWIGLWDENQLDDAASILGITFNAKSVK